MSRHLRFVWDVAKHVCFAFAFVVLLLFGVADCSSTQGLSFEFVHGVHIDTVCPGFHPGSSSEAATEQLFTIQYNTITLFKEGNAITYYSFLTYGPQKINK